MRKNHSIAISFLFMACWIVASCGGAPAGVAIGAPVPSFELPALGGGVLSSRSLEGKPVILNFWATWCQPCLKEIPVLNELDADPRAEVVAIALDEGSKEQVRSFVEKKAIEYQILFGNQEVFARFDGYGIPYTLVLDASQKLVNVYRGPATMEDLARDLESLSGAVGG